MADDSSSPLIGAIDQGTSSSRFLIFSGRTGKVVTFHQIECKQLFPNAGWVEMDATQMMDTTKHCMEEACNKLTTLGLSPKQIKAIGITNQRETSIVWDKNTGKPLFNAVVWLDARTASLADDLANSTSTKNKEHFKPITGLPIHPYFSALKLRWMIDNVPEIKKALDEGRAIAGTVDTWLIWNLTGGPNGGSHVTDVTNASRYLLMNLHNLQWDKTLLDFFNIPQSFLPQIRSSSEVYGTVADGILKGVPVSGCLGDQQSALVGQLCLTSGMGKNTYGTGTFMLYNTGQQPVISSHGLLTTVAFQLGAKEPTFYALEGSGSIGGTCVRWLRDNLNIIEDSKDVEALARSVPDTGGVYFVPCFTGLYTPYWDPEARGTICGLSQFSNKAHLARAALESVCFQTKEVVDAIEIDSGQKLRELKVDGGMTQNSLVMQTQADLLGVPVVRPDMAEITAFGAAIAAGMAVGVWDISWHKDHQPKCDRFEPKIATKETDARLAKWKSAVQRAQHWETD